MTLVLVLALGGAGGASGSYGAACFGDENCPSGQQCLRVGAASPCQPAPTGSRTFCGGFDSDSGGGEDAAEERQVGGSAVGGAGGRGGGCASGGGSAVQVHVVATAFALPACVLLTWSVMVRRAPRLHRWLGRVNGLVTLFAVVPTGLYLSLFAKGGLWSTAGFMLSGLIVAVAMVRAVKSARAGDLVTHRRAAMHVLAQLSVAVTSRTLLAAFTTTGVDEGVGYLVALRVPVVASVLAVELLLPRRSTTSLRRSHDPSPAAHLPHPHHARLGAVTGP